MAKGILKDEATYFNDSVTYTGNSGSETNRWVIEDVYDFVAIGTSGSSLSYRLVNDIDFRNHPTYKDGFYNLQLVMHEDGIFDGDGHAIKNIVLNNYSSVSFMCFNEIINTDFINLVLVNCAYKDPVIYGELYNCNFGIFVSDNTIYTPLNNSEICNCTFNIKGALKEGVYMKGGIQKSWINVELTINNEIVFELPSGYSGTRITNSYFTGKIKNNTKLYGSTSIMDEMIFINSYIAIEYDGGSSYSGIVVEGTGFIDKELWCKNGFTGLANNPSSGHIRTITTAQAQDVDYLNSIGFAVVPVS